MSEIEELLPNQILTDKKFFKGEVFWYGNKLHYIVDLVGGEPYSPFRYIFEIRQLAWQDAFNIESVSFRKPWIRIQRV